MGKLQGDNISYVAEVGSALMLWHGQYHTTHIMKSYSSIFRPGSGWAEFFTSILVWGIGIGCFQAAFNNFLVDMYRRPASSVLQPESHA